MARERSVLLVHPPFICPAAAPQLPAMAAASLRAAGASLSIYDGNQEFFLQHLLTPAFLQNCLERVQSNSTEGLYQGLTDSYLAEVLKDINKNHEQWRKRCAKAREIPQIMRGERFYEPADLVAARGDIDAILALGSLAYFPLRLHWNGLHHPDVNSWDAAYTFSQDQDNLFHVLSERFNQTSQDAQSLVFCIQCQDQMLPALTLWTDVSGNRPDLEALFWGPGLNAPKPPQGITWLDGDDPKALCDDLNLPDAGPQPPDYHGLDHCLAPELVPGGIGEYQMNQAPSLEELKAHKASDVVIAHWKAGQGTEVLSLGKALRLSSKAGMWNRVELAAVVEEDIADWCAANPNLAYSVLTKRQAAPGFSGPPPAPLPPEPMVSNLPPMPGRPLWRWLDQGPHLVMYVRKYGTRKTRITRVRDDNSIYRLGEGVEYHFVHYPDLTEWHVNSILDLITSTGKVKPDWLQYNLERSYLIAYVLEEGVMVATETLKHPRQEYIRKIRERTGLDFSKHLERGYIVVRPDYRGLGIGDQLIKNCLARVEGHKTFLAIGAENKVAQRLTARHGTRFLTRYYSEEMGKEIEIWTPQDQDDLPEGKED